MGTILHQFLLEGKHTEGVDYLKWTGATRSGAKWEGFREHCEERDLPYVIVNSKKDELGLINEQLRAIQKNSFAMELIEKTAVREQAIEWEQNGVRCKALIDMLLSDGPIVDLKTAADPSEKKFWWSLEDYGYHISAVYYEMARDALQQSSYEHPFYWIVVANEGWIYCKVYELPRDVRDVVKFQIESKLEHFRNCQQTGRWIDPELQRSNELHVTNYWLDKNGAGLIQS
jgi:hypothetical protein